MDIWQYKDPILYSLYIFLDSFAIEFILNDLNTVLVGRGRCIWILSNLGDYCPVYEFELADVREIDKQLVAKAIECPHRECLYEFDHERGSNYIYSSQSAKEVLRPFLDEPPKDNKVDKARVDVSY